MPFTYPQPIWKEIAPWMLEAFLGGTVRPETGDSEANIPREGPLVALFAPHTGWVESVVIDGCFRRIGRPCPAWVTKKENLAIPRLLVGDRLIYIDRERPEPRAVRTIYAVLDHPNGAIGSTLEGTRFGNPDDPDDLRTLGKFKSGLIRIAIRAQVPILPVLVLGADQVAPRLDRLWQSQGMRNAARVIQQLRARPQPIHVRLLQPYREHLELDSRQSVRERATLHAQRIRELFAAAILEACPDYPLGT